MARERLGSSRSPPVLYRRRRGTLSGRPWVLLCCWLLAFLLNGGGGGNNGRNVEPGHARHWSGGADAADVTADLAQTPDETNLGRLARACASYCHAGVDGLDLWMSFKDVCVTTTSPSFLKQMAIADKKGPSSSRQSSSLSNRYYSNSAAAATAAGAPLADSSIYSSTTQMAWPLLHSILLCSVVSTFSLFAGFRMGSRMVSVPKAALLPLL